MAQNVLGWCRAVQTSLENSMKIMKQLRRIQRHRMIWIYSGYQDIFKELLDTVVAAQCQYQCIGIRYCQIDVFNRAASVACTPQVLKLCWMTMRRHVKTLEMCWYFPNDRKNCRAFQGANGLANHVPWVQPVRWFFLVGFWAQCGAVWRSVGGSLYHLPTPSPADISMNIQRLESASLERRFGSTRVPIVPI